MVKTNYELKSNMRPTPNQVGIVDILLSNIGFDVRLLSLFPRPRVLAPLSNLTQFVEEKDPFALRSTNLVQKTKHSW